MGDNSNRTLGRFFSVGVVNTLLSLALYQGLIFIVCYRMAYTLAFAAGIAFAAAAYSRVVFYVPLTWATALRFSAAYLMLYVLGLYVTIGLVELVTVPERIAPIATAVLLLPISFLASRYALSSSGADEKS